MPPAGYEKVKSAADTDLAGKQVYLAQVPKSFDTANAVFKSDTEIVCNGVSYFVNSSASLADCAVLVADKDGALKPSSVTLAGLLALTERVPLPKVDYEKVHEEKPLVPQKPNLRMRHFPTGYGPASYGVDTTPVKRGHDAPSAGTAGTETPSKKHKKSHKHSDDVDAKKKHSKKSKDKKSKDKSSGKPE